MSEYHNGFGELKNRTNNYNLEFNIKPKSEFNSYLLKTGEDFEDFVLKKFNEYFEIMPRTESYPDYKIKFNPTRETFVIECKYKTRLNENSFTIDERQLNNYKEYKLKNNIPFFIVFGLGGKPSNPNKIFILPLDRIDQSGIKYEDLCSLKNMIKINPFILIVQ